MVILNEAGWIERAQEAIDELVAEGLIEKRLSVVGVAEVRWNDFEIALEGAPTLSAHLVPGFSFKDCVRRAALKDLKASQ